MWTLTKRLALMAVLGIFVFVTGCNTVEGVGEDIEDAGSRIEDAAD